MLALRPLVVVPDRLCLPVDEEASEGMGVRMQISPCCLFSLACARKYYSSSCALSKAGGVGRCDVQVDVVWLFFVDLFTGRSDSMF